MASVPKLHRPWLVAAWPGMGHVAVNAAVYLLAKMKMSLLAEIEATNLFDVDQVEVKDGLIEPVRRPRNRLFVWTDPKRKHDLVVFLGEAQPPIGKFEFCRQLVAHARELGVERVFTFAAMATEMRPENRSRTFAAAIDRDGLEELKRLELEVLQDGHIGGLNGVLLGAVVDAGLRGACLLGEMPHLFAQLPFPKASLSILEAFSVLADFEVDLSELAEQAKSADAQLTKFLNRIERQYQNPHEQAFEAEEEAMEEEPVDPQSRQRIETLFAEAIKDRSKAFELKQELDRLKLFKEYEDRFLDLFRKAGEP